MHPIFLRAQAHISAKLDRIREIKVSMESGNVRSGHVRSGKVRSGLVRLGEVQGGQVSSCQVKSGKMVSGQVREVQVRSGKVLTRPSTLELWSCLSYCLFLRIHHHRLYWYCQILIGQEYTCQNSSMLESFCFLWMAINKSKWKEIVIVQLTSVQLSGVGPKTLSE